ncbi:MAG: hypothetical protein RIN56_09550 [Sporomusaceae bacterium]|nr:hypothetical protein [Sporomusaceae bacterium]
MDLFLEYRWPILVVLEVLAWASTFLMFYARYRLRSTALFRAGVILTVLTGVIPQIGMGIINYLGTREIDLFTAVIVALILYGATAGKKDVRRLDSWVQNKYGRAE